MSASDWPAVQEIYRQGIATGMATFQTETPAWPAFDAGHLALCRLVLVEGESLLAWAALSPISARPVYRGVAEVSIYVADHARGRGRGRRLLASLVEASERAGVWTLQSSIFAINQPSLALHRACGFREVGRRERIAQLNGQWHDTLLLERRSPLTE